MVALVRQSAETAREAPPTIGFEGRLALATVEGLDAAALRLVGPRGSPTARTTRESRVWRPVPPLTA
jgi:hypothetical protein